MAKDQAKVGEGEVLDFEPGFAYVTFGLRIPEEIRDLYRDWNTEKVDLARLRSSIGSVLAEAFGEDYNAIRDVEYLPF